jgi:ribonuclease PH
MVDCDVLQADGGTRTAAITGSYVALQQAVRTLMNRGELSSNPITCAIASISVGIIDGEILLDLGYEEDSKADADFNIVMTDSGEFVEVQGTAESATFSRNALGQVLEIAEKGIGELFEVQTRVISQFGINPTAG